MKPHQVVSLDAPQELNHLIVHNQYKGCRYQYFPIIVSHLSAHTV